MALRSPDLAEDLERKHQDLYYRLRATGKGRLAISSLLGDPEDAVRTWAAIHSLEWDPDRAQSVLTAVAQGHGPFAVEAIWALRSYRAGQLLAALGVQGWDGQWLQPRHPSAEG